MIENPLNRPWLKVLALISAGVFGVFPFAKNAIAQEDALYTTLKTDVSPGTIPSLQIACAPKDAIRDGRFLWLKSSADICEARTPSGEIEQRIIGLPRPRQGGENAVAKIRELVSGNQQSVEFDLTWFDGGLVVTHEVWKNLGIHVLQTRDGGMNVLTLQRNAEVITPGRHAEGVVELSYPIENRTAYMVIVKQHCPDPTKVLYGLTEFQARSFRVPIPPQNLAMVN